MCQRIAKLTTLALLIGPALTAAQTAFTYQGRLEDLGAPANGSYNLVFTLWDSASGGSQIGGADSESGTQLTDGLFTVQLNDTGQFGVSAFNGTPRWVEVTVDGVSLAPRQPLTPAPFALYAFDGPGSGTNYWSANGSSIYYLGNVGIGTNSPARRLQVRSSMRVAHDGGSGPFILYGTGVLELKSNATGVDRPYGAVEYLDGDDNIRGSIDYGKDALLAPVGMRFRTEGATRMMVDATGNVGVGTVAPDAPLHVVEGASGATAHSRSIMTLERSGSGYLSILTPDNTERGILFGDPESNVNGGIIYNSGSTVDGLQFRTNGNVARMVITSAGNVGIGTGAPAAHLDVNGTARVNVLEIEGADVAEKFPISDARSAATPGTVMAIDSGHPGKLCVARGAYNQRVAGVVSGAGNLPVGAVLGHMPGCEDGPPIALSGRVWVRCTAQTQAIAPGDLLTTSNLPGHAMKAADANRSHGAVLGKAMTDLPQGSTGLVLVLVNLQ